MNSNEARPLRDYFTMQDYVKLEKSSKLSKYRAIFHNWRKRSSPNDTNSELIYSDKEIIPFDTFGIINPTKPQWYKDYNTVKHNREDFLENASLDNCMHAIAGILVLLYSQFGSQCIQKYRINHIKMYNDDYDGVFDADTIFSIVPPTISDWNTDELYDFDWNVLKETNRQFDKFAF